MSPTGEILDEFSQHRVDPSLLKMRHVDPKLKELLVGEPRIVQGATRGRQVRDKPRKPPYFNIAAMLEVPALTAMHRRMSTSPGKMKFKLTPSQERAQMQHQIRLANEERSRAKSK